MNSATYDMLLKNIEDKIPGMERIDFNLQFEAQQKNTVLALILSLFFGSLGIDRFYLEQYWLGFLKLITFGAGGIWTVVDWFLIVGATRIKNLQFADEIRVNEDYGIL